MSNSTICVATIAHTIVDITITLDQVDLRIKRLHKKRLQAERLLEKLEKVIKCDVEARKRPKFLSSLSLFLPAR